MIVSDLPPSLALLAGDSSPLPESSIPGELEREDMLVVLANWPSLGDVGEGGIIRNVLCRLELTYICAELYERWPPASSLSCCLRNATWAAMTRCLSAIRLQSEQAQSLHLQNLLWPLRMEMTPWFLHRAHFGDRCAIEPIEGIGEGFSSVEEGCNKNNGIRELNAEDPR